MRISDWSSDVCSSDLLQQTETRIVYYRSNRRHDHHRRADRFAALQISASHIEQHAAGENQEHNAGRRGCAGLPLHAPGERHEAERIDGGVRKIVEAIGDQGAGIAYRRSEEHTSELQSLMRISYAVFCLKK